MLRSSRRQICSALIALLLLFPLPTLASTYGSNSYGDCAYSTGCTAGTTNGSTAAADTAPAAPDQILLNDFSEYFSSAGKDLLLSVGQIIYFDITVDNVIQHHKVTIQAIGPDYVDIIIDSRTTTDRLSIGQPKRFEITGDSQDDIQITLKDLIDGKALLNFKALQAAIPIPAATTNPAASSHLIWWILLGLFGLFLIIGIWWFVWLRRRRQPPTTISTNQPPQ